MAKIKRKSYYSYNQNNKDEEIFEVFGCREYKQKCRDYEDEWTENVIEFLIYKRIFCRYE